mmetsp:Transcript_41965/g.96338  ORF Transcript_41965/g.96338 Transcript_41965/m.96338 type:complete len:585 (+) Transcript_41965:85-1839(+)
MDEALTDTPSRSPASPSVPPETRRLSSIEEALKRVSTEDIPLPSKEDLVRSVRGEYQRVQLATSIIFILLLFSVIVATLPVQDLATSVEGVRRFVKHSVTFTKLDGSEGTLESVASVDDAFLYSEALTKELMVSTQEDYAGQRPAGERFRLLRVHKLINAMLWSQRRVRPTDCAYPGFRSMYGMCYEGLAANELKTDHMTLDNGMEIKYLHEIGGFGVEIPYDSSKADSIMRKLKYGRFLDMATREFSVIFTFHNSPGHFTGVSAVTFAISEFGEVRADVTTEFLRLMPYSEETHGYLLLLLQVGAMLALGLRLYTFMYGIFAQPHTRWKIAKVLSPWALLEIANFLVLLRILFLWFTYLTDPARRSFDIAASHYQRILHLAEGFTNMVFWMAFAMLLSTVRMLEYLTALGMERASKVTHLLEAVIHSLASFALVFIFVFAGFTISFHVLLGAQNELFRSVADSARTLFLWFAALGEGQREVMDEPGGDLFMVLFIIFCMVILFNMFIAVVMAAHDEVMEGDHAHRPPNFEIADWICDKLGIEVYEKDPFLLISTRSLPALPTEGYGSMQTRAAALKKSKTDKF